MVCSWLLLLHRFAAQTRTLAGQVFTIGGAAALTLGTGFIGAAAVAGVGAAAVVKTSTTHEVRRRTAQESTPPHTHTPVSKNSFFFLGGGGFQVTLPTYF